VASFAGYTSPFGLRVHPVSGGVRPHEGIDIAAPLGSPVRNWWGGTLVDILQDGGCGNGLLIRSGDYEHLYCHLAGTVEADVYRSGSVQLRRGQRLRTGQTIGHVGLSGNTTGPHLHWGLRYRNSWLDPAAVLRAMAADRRQRQPIWRRPFNVGQFR
jgi:murein DD-endopeptidase MepM/ murein hydrolase activator NlpD